MLGRAKCSGQVMGGVDQRDVREGLRVIADQPSCDWIVFLGKQTDVVAQFEQSFLACGFWLADNYILQGRYDDARALFEPFIAG